MKKKFYLIILCVLMLAVTSCSAMFGPEPTPEPTATPAPTPEPFLMGDALDAFETQLYSANFQEAIDILEDYKQTHNKADDIQYDEAIAKLEKLIDIAQSDGLDLDKTDGRFSLDIAWDYQYGDEPLEITYHSDGIVYATFSYSDEDWIFFEKVFVKLGEGNYLDYEFDYFDINRNVGSGYILEFIIYKISLFDLEDLAEAEGEAYVLFRGKGIGSVDISPEYLEYIKSVAEFGLIFEELKGLI